MDQLFPRVGVGVMIFKEGKVLLGKRIGSHGAGEYAFPGGHLEHLESIEDCARRETLEECGCEIANVRFHLLYNMKTYAPKHYVHIGMVADWKSNEPENIEPDKCESWGWYGLDELPAPIFGACKVAFEAWRDNRTFIDS